MPGLLVAGSIALDSLRGGEIREELGGSALYFALAASRLVPVAMVAPVGRDAEARVRALLARHPRIDTTRLDVLDAPTYRWFAEAREGRNLDLGSQDSIYDAWHPRLPRSFRGWAFVGSMRPDQQLRIVRDLVGCRLLAADAMCSYVTQAPDLVHQVLRLVDWYFCNDEELTALGGSEPERFRARWGLGGLVVKHGPGGATAYTVRGTVHVPSRARRVEDTTGAGDALAAGMLAHWMLHGGAPDRLREALEVGSELAALTISAIGLRALDGPEAGGERDPGPRSGDGS
ncbi:MAG TPA: PfkB family carbohydrate kinase [Candidatus Dormibacteraeota bacterium]|nr:PfkB family carbohydrate kinase [Candidatus Dormibacteraeota bacterium]